MEIIEDHDDFWSYQQDLQNIKTAALDFVQTTKESMLGDCIALNNREWESYDNLLKALGVYDEIYGE